MMFKFIIFLTAAITITVSGFKQTLTVYDGINCNGSSVFFDKKVPNLEKYTQFLEQSKSMLLIGWWELYFEHNYSSRIGTLAGPKPACVNSNDGPWRPPWAPMFRNGSIRHLGPSETDTIAITLYNETEEFILDYPAEPNVPVIHPEFIFATGKSNWTLFEGKNYTGNFICLQSSNDVEIWGLGLDNVGSILKDCPTSKIPFQIIDDNDNE